MKGVVKTECEDNSDQIHKTGTKCGEMMSSYLDQYKKLFCPFSYLVLDQLHGNGSILEKDFLFIAFYEK